MSTEHTQAQTHPDPQPQREGEARVDTQIHPGSQSRARLRSIGRLSNRELLHQLQRLNQQKHALDAELLLTLSELDRRQLYREQACSSAFDFCVSRLGYSEDVAYKRVGAARMLRQYPLIYQLLAEGRIHLSALMLLRPHLTPENHEEWLLSACNKSKRQVEKLVASRCPQPDIATRIRRLPTTGTARSEVVDGSTAESQPTVTTPTMAASTGEPLGARHDPCAAAAALCAPAPLVKPSPSDAPVPLARATSIDASTQLAMTTSPSASKPASMTQLIPLSSCTYRVTFTAGEVLKQKLDRARELLSHCIAPSDLPALLERAIDQLIEREERRRYAAHSTRGVTSKAKRKASNAEPSNSESIDCDSSRLGQTQESCQNCSRSAFGEEDPDPVAAHNSPVNTNAYESCGMNTATSKDDDAPVVRCNPAECAPSKRLRRAVPAAVRREVWLRDEGQCTFIDQSGRRCCERHFLELDHVEAFALGGGETVSNLRLRCSCHNAHEAETLFGRRLIDGAISHEKHKRNLG